MFLWIAWSESQNNGTFYVSLDSMLLYPCFQ